MKKIKTVNKNERLKEFIVLNHQQNSTSKFLNKYIKCRRQISWVFI